MKLYKGLIYSVAASVLLAGCANEAPFTEPSILGQTGSLKTSCLAPKLTNAEGVEVGTRAAVPSTDDFNVVITRKNKARSESTEGSVEYKYSDMPEVLTLPVGDYTVYAHHGENQPAAWDSPYYYGESEFGIDANKITDDVDPIVAKLSNIRVTIVFHPSLLSTMSADSKVEVKVGDQGVMTFKPEETRSAYFKYVNNSQTLVATFTGLVEGVEVVETESRDNVLPGNHYRITFRMHGIDDDDPGIVSPTIVVDTTVEDDNKDYTINGEDEGYLDDDQRPNQGGQDEPTPPIGDGPAPIPIVLDPTGEYAGYDKIDLDKVNEVTDHLYCAWKVVSEAESGFEEFTVKIISDTLTPDALESVGLVSHLNLIDPGDYEEALDGLGFPTNIGGQDEASFDITSFLTLMAKLGEANHEFRMTVSDANGTSVISLRLHTPKKTK